MGVARLPDSNHLMDQRWVLVAWSCWPDFDLTLAQHYHYHNYIVSKMTEWQRVFFSIMKLNPSN